MIERTDLISSKLGVTNCDRFQQNSILEEQGCYEGMKSGLLPIQGLTFAALAIRVWAHVERQRQR